MVLTGLDLGAWLTESGAVVLLYEYDEVTQVLIGYVVHPMREVRYGKDGRLVSCCFLPGESQTVEHEQNLHKWLHLDRKLGDVDAIITVNQVEWEKSYAGEAAPAPAPHEDWVEITDPDHVLRAGIDYINENGMGWWTRQTNDPLLSIAVMRHSQPSATLKFRCLRHHHPDFAPARRQDSAGAGIYDEQPPLVNTYADRTLNASRLLRDAVDEAKAVFDTPASIDSSDSPRMEPYGSREYVVITSGGLTVSLVAECFGWKGNKVEFFIEETIIATFLSPQSVVGKTTEKERGTVLTDPVVKVSTEQLGPLGNVLRDLQMAVKQDTCSEYIRREVMRCCEEFRKVVSP